MFKKRILSGIEKYPEQEYLNEVRNLSKEASIKYIKSRVKEVGYSVHPNFEDWLEEVENEDVMFHLHFAMTLKLYDRNDHYSRFRLLWDKIYWQNWKE